MGFLIFGRVPPVPRTLFQVAATFGFTRETNFGPLFEVRSEPVATDLAYTSLPLDPHTDNPYRWPVPGVQLLHCLANETSGGLSTLVDGFAAAEALRVRDNAAFKLLARTPVRFRYRDDTTDLVASAPPIELDAAEGLLSIHFSPRLDFVPLGPPEGLDWVLSRPPGVRSPVAVAGIRDSVPAGDRGFAHDGQPAVVAWTDWLRSGGGAAASAGVLYRHRWAAEPLSCVAAAVDGGSGGVRVRGGWGMSKPMVSFRRMEDGTRADYLLLDESERNYAARLPDHLLEALRKLDHSLEGYPVSRLGHSFAGGHAGLRRRGRQGTAGCGIDSRHRG